MTVTSRAKQVLVRVDKCGIFAKEGEEHSLTARWRGIWANISTAMAPSVRRGAVRGVFVGDELKGLAPADLNAVAGAIRDSLDGLSTGHSGAPIVYYNEAGPHAIKEEFKVPAALTHLSIDDYGLNASSLRSVYQGAAPEL